MRSIGWLLLTTVVSFTSAQAQTDIQLGSAVTLHWSHNQAGDTPTQSGLAEWFHFTQTLQTLELLASELDRHTDLAKVAQATHCRISFEADVLGSKVDIGGWVGYRSYWRMSGFNSAQFRKIDFSDEVRAFTHGPVPKEVDLERLETEKTSGEAVARLLKTLDPFLIAAKQTGMTCDEPPPVVAPIVVPVIEPIVAPVIAPVEKPVEEPMVKPKKKQPNVSKGKSTPATGQEALDIKPIASNKKATGGIPQLLKTTKAKGAVLSTAAVLEKVNQKEKLTEEELAFIKAPDIYVQFQGCKDSFQDRNAAETELNKILAYLHYQPNARVTIRGWIDGGGGGSGGRGGGGASSLILGKSTAALQQNVQCNEGGYAGQAVSALMEGRADVVRSWLVKKGIARSRIEVTTGEVGSGPASRKITVEYTQ